MLLEEGERQFLHFGFLELQLICLASWFQGSGTRSETAKTVAWILLSMGFAEVREGGSHKNLRHSSGHPITVLFHYGYVDLPPCSSSRPRQTKGHRSCWQSRGLTIVYRRLASQKKFLLRQAFNGVGFHKQQ
jgi:predicted RNA binding protein YcfA (HicA-like mRNA interferase family)